MNQISAKKEFATLSYTFQQTGVCDRNDMPALRVSKAIHYICTIFSLCLHLYNFFSLPSSVQFFFSKATLLKKTMISGIMHLRK